MRAHLTCNPGADKPFVVTLVNARGPKKARTFKTFVGAIRHAVKQTAATKPAKPSKDSRKIGRKKCAPVFSAADTGLRRFKVSGKRKMAAGPGCVLVSRTIVARSRKLAGDTFRDATNATPFSVRMLPGKPEGSAAKTKRTKGNLSARRRRQRGATETRVLRAAGLK